MTLCFCGGEIATHKDRAMCMACGHMTTLPAGEPDCSVDGCSRKASVRGWCEKHYIRWRVTGDPKATKRGRHGTYLEYIHELPVGVSECIEWPASRDKNGYGRMSFMGKTTRAHRVCAVVFHGEPNSSDLVAAHSCGNPACVNPEHIRWATQKENAADRVLHKTETIGQKNGRSKLSKRDVLAIRKRIASEKASDLAKEFMVSPCTIHEIKNRRKWAWLQ